MRTRLVTAAVLLFPSAPASAQLHAGEVPNGSSALDLNIEIVLNASFTTDSASLELDCDDFMDAWAVLVHGAPPIDAPNVAMLHMVDDDVEFCADFGAGFQQRPKYYDFDQLLDCSGDFEWQGGSQIVLGDFGGFTAIGPIEVDSMYVAYRRGAQVGWILLSFVLNDGPAVNMQVHQVLPLCPGTMPVAPDEPPPTVALFPNPTSGQPVRVESADALRRIELLDASGRILASYAGTVRTIAAPDGAGTYVIRATHTDGRRSSARLVRY